MGTRYFTPKLFAFLRDLAANNQRAWFRAHEEDYERHVRQPALRFITDMAEPLAEISPHFTAEAARVGGSLLRIQRDMRFSSNGAPYHTGTGIHLRHVRARDVAAPGFYLRIEPGRCFVGVGLMHPESRVAYAIRDSIASRPEQWRSATRQEGFTDRFRLVGDSLVRLPQGYDPQHPLIHDLQRKDFAAAATLTHRQVTSADFLDRFVQECHRGAPLVRFLCEAVGVPF